METNDLLNQVKGLLTTGSDISVARLREMLEFLQEVKDKCRAEVEQESSAETASLDLQRKQSELEHVERMRALELGLPISDKGEIGKAHSAIWAAAIVGVLVSLALIGGAITTTVLALRPLGVVGDGVVRIFDFTLDRQVALVAIAWKVCGLASLIIAWLSLRTIRKARETAVDKGRPKVVANTESPIHRE